MRSVSAGRILSVVVPVYNSATILPRLVAPLRGVLAQVAPEHEIVLVNDHSSDDSWTGVVELVKDSSTSTCCSARTTRLPFTRPDGPGVEQRIHTSRPQPRSASASADERSAPRALR